MSEPSATPAAGSGRILAVDALRGATIAAMILVNNPGSWGQMYGPLGHADWHGWTPTDLVFPFFLFLVGTSIVFALQKRLDQGADRGALLRKIGIRAFALVAIGLALNAFPFTNLEGALEFRPDVQRLRWPGVLQRIGVCYGVAALLFVYVRRPRPLAWITAALLLGYYAAMMWWPVPVHGAGQIDAEGTHLAAWVDQQLLWNHMWGITKNAYDPEGVLSTVPAVATALLGIFAGRILIDREASAADKTLRLFVLGSILLVAGYAWSWGFPINKKIWTSSYVLFTAGQAMCALGLFAYFADVRGHKAWVKPLQIYGVNALTVFVMSGLLAKTLYRISFDVSVETDAGSVVTQVWNAKRWLYETFVLTWASGRFASLVFALCWVGGFFVLLRWMYRRGIVVRV